MRRRGRGVALAAVALALIAWLAVAAYHVVQGQHAASEGIASLRVAERGASYDSLRSGQVLAPLRSAERSFARADHHFGALSLKPLRITPIAGRQLRAAAALAQAARSVTAAAVTATTRTNVALSRPTTDGPGRLRLVEDLAQIAGDAAARVRRVGLGPREALISPLAEKRALFADRLAKLRQRLDDASHTCSGLASLLSGPTKVLVLAANPAEMRAGIGTFLSAGDLTVQGGNVTMNGFVPTGDLVVPDSSAAPPIGDADLAARWGWLQPNREWRNLGASPRFAASAALARDLWRAAGRGTVDDVIALDPIAVQAVLRATGPQTAGSTTISADDVVSLLLHDQYEHLPAAPTPGDSRQTARRDQLGDIARTALVAVTGGHVDTGLLASGLAGAIAGRHLQAWSATPGGTDLWANLHMQGDLTASSAMVSVLNRGGNKLDQYLAVHSDLTISHGTATLDVRLDNRTPDGQSGYIVGPYPGSGLKPGEYSGLLSVDLPSFATNVTVGGARPFVAAGPDGAAQVAALQVTVARGESTHITFDFKVPEHGTLRVEPSGRLPAGEWTFRGQQWSDTGARTVTW